MQRKSEEPKKVTDDIFKSPSLKEEWVKIHNIQSALQIKLQNSLEKRKKNDVKSIENLMEKIDNNLSAMSACKRGFNLPKRKLSRVIDFLKELTNKKRVRYGAMPENSTQQKVLFEDVIIAYTEKDDVVIFREIEVKIEKKIRLKTDLKILDGSENI